MQCSLVIQWMKAFLASTKITASVLSSSNVHHILWTATSAPDCNQETVWRGPAASWIFSFSTHPMQLTTILRKTSHTSTGLTPGFLSRGISRHDTKASNVKGSNVSVANFLAKIAIWVLSSLFSTLHLQLHSRWWCCIASSCDESSASFVRDDAFDTFSS